jgi:hypothetical protein
MSPEEVARTHQFRDGFTLVDYGEVGLPIFRLTLEAVTTTYRSLPTIQEFAMRCMAMGIAQEEEIARILGLQQELVSAAIDMLVTGRYVAREAPGERAAFRLTDTGRVRLEEELEELPQEEMLVIDYDGVMRTPVRLAGTSVRRASELRTDGAVEIRPYPAEPPGIDELSIPQVAKVIRRHGGEQFRRTVLALKRVARRNNLFREAVALVFAADRGAEVQVAFAIDGKLSEAHERAFAENGGPRKMGFVRALADSDMRRRLNRLIGREAISAFPDPSLVQSLRREEAEGEAQVRGLEPAAQDGRSNTIARHALRSARERLHAARHALDAMAVRPLACHEQSRLLEEALRDVSKSLIITSAGLQPLVVNGFFLRQLDLVSKSSTILIETPLTPQREPRGKAAVDPLAELTRRSCKGGLELRKGPRRQLYFLIKDDDLAVVSCRPFLGDANRRSGFVRVDGIVTRKPDQVRAIRDAFWASSRAAPRHG